MTQEEKAKRYDEALHKAKNYYSTTDSSSDIKLIGLIFPELKECEGEKIRKRIIQALHGDVLEMSEIKEAVDWLENQGKHSNFLSKIEVGDKVTRNEDGVLVNLSQLERVAKPRSIKPTDKIEPKFKVGDYIISNNNSEIIYHITGTGINESGSPDYVCEHVGREKEYNGRIYNMRQDKVDANFRLWTIQDAKDGDVLVYRDGQWIFIYKKKIDDNYFSYYTLYSTIHQDLTINDAGFTLLVSAIIPATIEQRDTLERAMADAGYTFDFEKKELKKIEQTSADETPYPETLEKAIDLYYYSYGNGKGEFEHLSLEKFRDIVHTFVSDYEQKSAWSEEDDYNLQCMIAKVTSDIQKGNIGRNNELIDWLKSLKERHTWKPSDEQMDALRYVTNFDYGGYKATLVSLYEQLKKLRGE